MQKDMARQSARVHVIFGILRETRTETGMASKRTLNPGNPCQNDFYTRKKDKAVGLTGTKQNGLHLVDEPGGLSDLVLGYQQSGQGGPCPLHHGQ